jgi:hypothetical protein
MEKFEAGADNDDSAATGEKSTFRGNGIARLCFPMFGNQN